MEMQYEAETWHVGTFGLKKANDEVARPQIGGQEHAQVYHLSHIAKEAECYGVWLRRCIFGTRTWSWPSRRGLLTSLLSFSWPNAPTCKISGPYCISMTWWRHLWYTDLAFPQEARLDLWGQLVLCKLELPWQSQPIVYHNLPETNLSQNNGHCLTVLSSKGNRISLPDVAGPDFVPTYI